MKDGEDSRVPFICFSLFALTLSLYLQATQFEFLVYDDPLYVTQNGWVKEGLTWENFVRAFTSIQVNNWHPLTMLSHMLDVELFGLSPGGHHLTNIILHSLNSALLFYVLRQMTRSTWRSAAVACLFAWHPLHVESVAWISERKDVLSAFFGLWTIWAYSRYCQIETERGADPSKGNSSVAPFHVYYILAILFFALGLMSKPMLVTLPFILLLLDFWPLGRIKEKQTRATAWALQHRRLVLEKVPFFLLTIASCIVTVYAQGKAIKPIDQFPLAGRIENAFVSYGSYFLDTLWPRHLAVFYPRPDNWPGWQTTLAVLALAAISIPVFAHRWRRRFLLTGWLWFLGALVPVIGLVQAGGQARADRYTYLPLIGLFILIVWGASSLVQHRRKASQIFLPISLCAVVALAWATHRQLQYWKDSETLFRHAHAVTKNNTLASFNLGFTLFEKGRFDESLLFFKQALLLSPRDPDISHYAGQALCQLGRPEEAAEHLWVAEQTFGKSPGKVTSQTPEPVDQRSFTETSIGLAMVFRKNQQEAISHFEKALELDPTQVLACNELAWIRATAMDPNLRNGPEAVRLAEFACETTGWKRLEFIGTLDAAYAECGKFEEAISTAEKLIVAAAKESQTYLMELAQKRLALYRSRKPFHQ